MKTTEILDLADMAVPTLKALFSGREENALLHVAAELGDRLSYEAETDEDWDEDQDGDPICRTTTVVELSCDGEVIGSGEAYGFYSHCKCGGKQWSEWQCDDGPDHDSRWMIIAGMLVAAGVIDSNDDLDAEIEAPDEPAEPEECDNGEYVVLYHGYEQAWTVKSRHATKEAAERAARIGDRKTTEANSTGAYGWEYAVAYLDRDGPEKIDGLTLSFCITK